MAWIGTITSVLAQKTGMQSYPALGISFDIPEGWIGQETNDGMILGHPTIAGIIVLSTHTYKTLDELKSEAKVGLQDGAGTNLQLTGQPEVLDKMAISAHYQGTIQGQPAKAFAIGILNPHGTGVMALAIANNNVYQPSLETAVRNLRKTMKFNPPVVGPIIDQWKNLLRGTRLTYMESYTSGSSYDGGIGGGYSSESRIDLCSEGYFKFASNSSVGVGGTGVSGYAGGRDRGAGTWTIEVEQGAPLLVLHFHNGESQQYQIAMEGDKLFLNGRRYFRTSDGEYAPDCP